MPMRAQTREVFCSACMRMRPLSQRTRALHVNLRGELTISQPEHMGIAEYERPGTIFACGDGDVLVLVERYLHTRGFNAEHALHLSAPGHTGHDLTGYLA